MDTNKMKLHHSLNYLLYIIFLTAIPLFLPSFVSAEVCGKYKEKYLTHKAGIKRKKLEVDRAQKRVDEVARRHERRAKKAFKRGDSYRISFGKSKSFNKLIEKMREYNALVEEGEELYANYKTCYRKYKKKLKKKNAKVKKYNDAVRKRNKLSKASSKGKKKRIVREIRNYEAY